MIKEAAIVFLLFFIYRVYRSRKAIWQNMHFYGEYLANYLRVKQDERKKK
jgi:hypothetical protein